MFHIQDSLHGRVYEKELFEFWPPHTEWICPHDLQQSTPTTRLI